MMRLRFARRRPARGAGRAWLVLGLALPAAVAGVPLLAHGPAAAPAPGSATDSAFVRKHYRKHEYRVPMRDGTELFTAVYVPVEASPSHRYPVMLTRTPFSVAPYGDDAYPRALGPDPQMLHDGYIFAYQDVRGRYMSGGTFENVRPLLPDSVKARNRLATDEATDTYDTIAWLLAHVAGNNGRVGVWGISYGGFYAVQALHAHHPALVAVSPQAPLTDLFFEDYHHNGALTQGYFTSYPIFGIPRGAPTPDPWWLPEFQRLDALSQPDDYQWQLSLGAVGTFGDRFYAGNTLWRDIVAHPDYDQFWRERSAVRTLRGVTAAVLVVGGWFDAEDLAGPFAVTRALRRDSPGAPVWLVVGPFGHRGWTESGTAHSMVGPIYFGDSLALRFQREVEAPFFRAHLKGQGAAPVAGARMFDTGRKAWRAFTAWPPPAAVPTSYYLGADAGVSATPPTSVATWRRYTSNPQAPVPTRCSGPTLPDLTLYMIDDQRCLDARADVLTFQGDVLTREVTVAGPLHARLRVSLTGTDADFVVKLIDVYPAGAEAERQACAAGGAAASGDPWGSDSLAGYQQLVRGEIMPGRFRRSFSTPEPFQPDVATTVNVTLPDVLHTFRCGHRIMVQVQSSWFPMFARNPQTFLNNPYRAMAGDYVPVTVRVETGGRDGSAIVLPVLR